MKTEIQHGIYFENGRKFYCGGIPVVEVHGSWFQMGRQYGALLRGELEKIHAFAKQAPDGMARVGQLSRGSISGLKRYDELFRGMAETSGFSLEQLRIISSVEVIYLDCITSAADFQRRMLFFAGSLGRLHPQRQGSFRTEFRLAAGI